MDPTQCLRDDHTVILDMLRRFESVLTTMRAAGMYRGGDIDDFVTFFRGYADACHHRKEEQALFPLLIEAGLPSDNGPVQRMLQEHDLGRGYLRDIERAAASDDALVDLLAAGTAYVDLLRDHIAKENQVLFAMAADLLDGNSAERLRAMFETVEADATYSETRARCEAIAKALTCNSA